MFDPSTNPMGLMQARCDEKGRLRIPRVFEEAMAEQKTWFLAPDARSDSLQIRSSGGKDALKVEIDKDGRMQLPPEVAAQFKNATVILLWKIDHLEVTRHG